MNSDEVIQKEYEGGRMRRPRARSVLKPKKPTKVNKQALLRKRLMKHFGGFFNEMQEDPPMPPPSMSPPSMSPQDGGRRPRRRANSPVRRAKSPVRKAPVRRRRLGGEGSVVKDMMNFGYDYGMKPFGTPDIMNAAGNFPRQSYDLGVNTIGQVSGQVGNLFSGGRKRRVVRAASPKRRSASPKRRPARRVMVRPMFN